MTTAAELKSFLEVHIKSRRTNIEEFVAKLYDEDGTLRPANYLTTAFSWVDGTTVAAGELGVFEDVLKGVNNRLEDGADDEAIIDMVKSMSMQFLVRNATYISSKSTLNSSNLEKQAQVQAYAKLVTLCDGGIV